MLSSLNLALQVGYASISLADVAAAQALKRAEKMAQLARLADELYSVRGVEFAREAALRKEITAARRAISKVRN